MVPGHYYNRIVFAVIAVVLLALTLGQSRGSNDIPSIVAPLHAQASQASGDVVFIPVGNQDVRKMVFWDRRNNQIHIYGGNGKFEETWQVGTLGQDLKKQ